MSFISDDQLGAFANPLVDDPTGLRNWLVFKNIVLGESDYPDSSDSESSYEDRDQDDN